MHDLICDGIIYHQQLGWQVYLSIQRHIGEEHSLHKMATATDLTIMTSLSPSAYTVIMTHTGSGGFKGRPPSPPLAHVLKKAVFFCVKGIYFVVRICDK